MKKHPSKIEKLGWCNLVFKVGLKTVVPKIVLAQVEPKNLFQEPGGRPGNKNTLRSLQKAETGLRSCWRPSVVAGTEEKREGVMKKHPSKIEKLGWCNRVFRVGLKTAQGYFWSWLEVPEIVLARVEPKKVSLEPGGRPGKQW